MKLDGKEIWQPELYEHWLKEGDALLLSGRVEASIDEQRGFNTYIVLRQNIEERALLEHIRQASVVPSQNSENSPRNTKSHEA